MKYILCVLLLISAFASAKDKLLGATSDDVEFRVNDKQQTVVYIQKSAIPGTTLLRQMSYGVGDSNDANQANTCFYLVKGNIETMDDVRHLLTADSVLQVSCSHGNAH